MSLIWVEIDYKLEWNSCRKKGRIAHLRCDFCTKQTTKIFHRNQVWNHKHTWFCDRECHRQAQKKGGILDEQKRRLFIENWGVDNPMKHQSVKDLVKDEEGRVGFGRPDVRIKAQQTMIERYGAAHPQQVVEIHIKTERTNLERYGAENVFASDYAKSKSIETNLSKRGVRYASQDEFVKQKIRQTNLECRGVENPSQDEKVKEKFRSTCLEKFGVENPFASEEIKAKIDYAANFWKAFETRKKNGTLRKSKIEDTFYRYLVSLFGEESVERYVRINNWEVDFYIRSLNRYVEFDGVYWHGLDRDLDRIERSNSLRDKQILKHYHNDRKKDAWFKTNDLVLERVTDVEFKAALKAKMI